MLVLALDTSAAASAAVVSDDGVLAEHTIFGARRHAEVLVPAVEQVLAEAGAQAGDFDAVAVGIGPGPYTGLRVGIATALGFGLGWSVPVHGVLSIDALAWQLASAGCVPTDFAVAIDARRKEVYWGRYSGVDSAGTPRLAAGPDVSTPTDFASAIEGVPRGGRGILLYPDLLGEAVSDKPELVEPLASGIGEIAVRRTAAGMTLEEPRPRYLRRPDAASPKPPKRVLG
ncbi:tRNA (adenosine(37)-N6)-threonylcarbamoyltransferase complex dimerization subunit type 1 TsaB [Saxibacter everestensis]|uniref:tRNA (Adenosine(37)-N6)-threonylcarbamoyltransferase complex dimerization subunit type 1 TsaB n=1 Tax=Saxibacter everestensis TaxID=2909229 RepID=A0ABY8QVR6_9MICO|nr:tRNA (adenosine(37)-N6)-threonylcarbamoyltransferase complex dimerization subunit type 1 TsaB [Brevibacteriaceae bacterium ZFBP1038]